MSSQTITPETLHTVDTLFKEEFESEQDEYKPDTKRAKQTGDKRKRGGAKGVPWTPEERVKLFEAMLAGKKGADLEAALPGRSAHQCQTTWRLQKTSSLSSPLIMSNSSTKAGAVSASSDISVKEESASGYESDPARVAGKGGAWSGDELKALFNGVLAGKKGDELASCVPGRTANQCRTTWQ
ncbi:hypothetical protein A1Q2_04060 [Trichosporon asahii var. asahii CBS 8904]|uniref:Myb-like domain-containing protein n=2 Tax=Trichosporon asahii var. asahii TaxID=189963 RepID=K1WK61_TRIAC|nr:hypothetical protein A1Q1_00200 [Trichosporon asahii var. asahii CBS 2479]EJT50502.1 hypothetical protein A1Q1_00200 [Trichosporon asahii var. asahii CBS 2479]EKD01689.1 hypothetical protein A1Q2_04060 [Trichosporon asahii var. asahii CBS 8904]